MSDPKVKIAPISERPAHFWLSEEVAKLKAPSGEVVRINRAITNPFVFLMVGDNNEAEIDLTEFMKSIAIQVSSSEPPAPALPEQQP